MRTKGTFGSLHKTARGTWRARYPNPLMPNGQPPVEKTFKYKNDAMSWLCDEEKLVRDHWAGRAQWTSPKERAQKRRERELRRTVTLAAYAENRLAHYRKRDGGKPAEAYMRKKRECLRHLSDAAFWNKRIAAITPQDVNKWRNHNELAPHALRRTWQELKAIMAQAESEGLVERNPVTGQAPKVPPSKQALIPPATAEELHAIYEAMPAYCRISVYLGALFDLRIGEVCALQCRDFDLTHHVLRIRHSVGKGEGDRGSRRLKEPKNPASYAAIPIPDAITPMIRAQINGRPGEAMLIESPRDDYHILTPEALRRRFKAACAQAGRADLHFHTLRATAITAMTHVGATLSETMAIGRHSDVQTSVIRYQRATVQRVRHVMDGVAETLLA